MGPFRDLLIVALAGVAAGCSEERPGFEPRHVFLVTVEHLRADRCSFLMHDRPTTWMPSDESMREEHRAFGLDEIAADGVVFANSYAPSPLRDVSLATLLAARAPLETGVLGKGDELPGELVTLGEAFRAGGFRTAAFLGGRDPLDPSFARGFEHVESFDADQEALLAAAEWLGADPGDGARTLVWVHLAGLAPPWTPREAVPDADALLGTRVFPDADAPGRPDGSLESIRAIHAALEPPSSADRVATGAVYDRALAHLVAQIWLGLYRTFDYHTARAEASETWARTVFVLAGVNGVELLENGAIGAEGMLSDGTLHVPLFFRHPDSLTGERILADVVGLEDVAPTLLEWMRLPPLPASRGRSLLPVLDSYVERSFASHPAFAQLPERAVFSVRDERYRLVLNPTRTQPAGRPLSAGPMREVSLHDHESDPAGIRDVARDHPEVVMRLTAAIRAWRESQTLFHTTARVASPGAR